MSQSRNLEEIRRNYQLSSLDDKDLLPDPIEMFNRWWDDVMNSEVPEPNAMTLATVDKEGKPCARVVLLKHVSPEGFEFFTNYNSPKGKEIELNPHVALVFYWKELERQVRIEGVAAKMSREKSQVYFQSRPRGNQIGAWASPQSEVISDRHTLEQEIEKITDRFENVNPLPCPDHWGGYKVHPDMIEFWQGGSERLHDRFKYVLGSDGISWTILRLAP